MLAQAHGYPGCSPAGRSPVVLHPNASNGLTQPYAEPGDYLTLLAKVCAGMRRVLALVVSADNSNAPLRGAQCWE